MNKSLFAAVRAVEKKFGEDAVIIGNKSKVDINCPKISTGSYSLNEALGGYGIPFGRVIEIFGPESSGKTTLALHLIANAQKKKGLAAFVDAEHSLDINYARRLGINTEELIVSQPDYGEQALGIVELLVKKGVSLIVVDSVAALVPKAELDGEMDDVQIGLQARLISKAMRKLIGVVNKTNALVVFINQTRAKIGMGWCRGGDTTPGGKALKFYASVRIEVKRIKSEKKGEHFVNNFINAKVVKSKVCIPFKIGHFYITFGKGIDKWEEIFYWAKKGKIIKLSQSIYKFGKIKEKGKEAFIKKIKGKRIARKKLIIETKKYIKACYK
jgi:recombination protein RecA